MHRASAALAVITTFLGASESNGLADAIQQRRARVNAKMVVFAIDVQRDRDSARDGGSARDCRRRAALCRSAIRANRCATSNDCDSRSTSHRAQKCPAARIGWARLFVVIHTVSSSEQLMEQHYLGNFAL